jgi:hypothetical protein
MHQDDNAVNNLVDRKKRPYIPRFLAISFTFSAL